MFVTEVFGQLGVQRGLEGVLRQLVQQATWPTRLTPCPLVCVGGRSASSL